MATVSAPAPARKPKPRVKPVRTLRLVLPVVERSPGLVRIAESQAQRQKADYYLVQRIGSDWGDGFRVLKTGQEPEAAAYHVHLSDEGHSCDCKGHERWGHCRHVSALVTLRSLGKL